MPSPCHIAASIEAGFTVELYLSGVKIFPDARKSSQIDPSPPPTT